MGALTAEDRLAILDLLARYAHAMDDGDADAFVRCFVQDPFLDVVNRTVSGAAELRAFADYYAAKPGRPGWQHHITTVAIDGDGQHCRTRAYMLLVERDATGKTVHGGHADYLDECVKIDGRWLLKSHVVRV